MKESEYTLSEIILQKINKSHDELDVLRSTLQKARLDDLEDDILINLTHAISKEVGIARGLILALEVINEFQ